ncbi:MAG: mechanosensitive ion channel domain-containing protein [Planctomycetota bacterium]
MSSEEPKRPDEPENELPNADPGESETTSIDSEENTGDDKPTEQEIVEQLQESDQNDSGPNETLRRHIENYSQYGPLFASLAYTIIGAVFVPAVLLFLFVQLSPVYDLADLRGAVQRGLGSLVLPLLVALVLSRAVVKQGLAKRHLGWSPLLCKALHVALNSIVFVVLPLRFFYVGLETFESGKWNDSLGRLIFILAMTGLAIGLIVTVGRLNRWLDEVRGSRPWYMSVRGLLLLFLPAMPITLIIMAATGYYFTAEELSSRTVWTVLLMVGIALVGGLFSRLLMIAQFVIKLRELDRDEDGQISSDESIDIQAISTQVNRLIRATSLVVMLLVGWQVWSTVLPAINYLDQVQLWQIVTAATDGSAAGVTTWITLRHLLIATGMLVITYILSSNLPGLLEITLLDRLPLDRGGRYAISFIVRYLVGIIGILAACQLLGFSWNRVQWLAAGLTVGLGFGLQEIFANLISGLIILIERPIRVGDVVTVNNTTGTVTKMALRATTIMDLDYRELIVPNKKFITEDVMNWTLSDNKSRLVVKVGVAYGSDTTLVQNTLLKVANRYPLAVRDPAPQSVFCGFGDSTLDFELRIVIPTRDVFVQATHELHMLVDEAFRQKDIEIAFPQRDLYIKNMGELGQYISPGSSGGSGGPTGSPAATSANSKKITPGPRAETDLNLVNDDNDTTGESKRSGDENREDFGHQKKRA